LPNVKAQQRRTGELGKTERSKHRRCAVASGSPPFFLLKTSWSGIQNFLVRFLERFAWSLRFSTPATSFFSDYILPIHRRLSISTDSLSRGKTGASEFKFIFGERPRSAMAMSGATSCAAGIVTDIDIAL
jgi:hypothetical protein